MPYDSNGNYTLPAIYKAKPATTIMTEQHNNPLEDIQTALNSVLLRNGSAPMTGPLNMGINKVINLADGVENTDAATVGQSLMLKGESTQEVTGPITFSGAVIVPAVTNWSLYQPIGALDADNRYIRSPAAPTTDFRILTISRNKTTGGFWVVAEDGSNTQLQTAGDYATNSALNAEATARVEADNTKVSKFGDTMPGALYSNSYLGGGLNGGMSGDTTTGSYRYTNGGVSFGDPSGSGNLKGSWGVTDVYGISGDDRAGINLTGFDFSKNLYQWYFAWNGNITTPKGKVAFLSDIPADIAKLSDLPLDAGKIILAWNGTVTGNATIPFPRTLSWVDTVIICASRETTGGKASSVINTLNWNNSSANVSAVAFSGSNQALSTMDYRALVIGNK